MSRGFQRTFWGLLPVPEKILSTRKKFKINTKSFPKVKRELLKNFGSEFSKKDL